MINRASKILSLSVFCSPHFLAMVWLFFS
jgi:hypothetical protein